MPKPILRSPIITGGCSTNPSPTAGAQARRQSDHRSACRARGRLQHKPIGIAESPATGESRRGDVNDHGSATCAGGCSTNP